MKRLVLFSSPKSCDFEEILSKIFPQELENKVLAYLPTYAKYLNQEYTDFWKSVADRFNAEFIYMGIDKGTDKDKVEMLKKANVLVMTGGNTFWLLDYLRTSGLDKAILEMTKNDDYVIAGWSAGAMVMTPTIAIGGLPHRDGGKSPMDENKVKLSDLNGLSLVDFEIFPHYLESDQKQTLEDYKKETKNEVRALTDDEYIVIDL
jgi:dipeptidase E